MKKPYAVVLVEWFPQCRVQRDFEGFDDRQAMHDFFGVWCEESEEEDHPVVVTEVLDTATMTLGRVSPHGEDAERRAAIIVAEPSRLVGTRQNKGKANISWINQTLATGGDFSYLTDVMDDVPSYLHLPTEDAEGWNIPPEHFDAAVAAALPRIEQGQRVFIHCHMGVNRGPSTAYAVLLAQGFGATEAFDMIRAARPIAGVAYAKDALKWWSRRQGWDQETSQAALATLTSHIDTALGAKDIRVIQRAVRKAANSDDLEFAEIQW